LQLEDFGFDPWFRSRFTPFAEAGLEPGRVASAHGGMLRVLTAAGERTVHLAGRLRHQTVSAADLPAVGDWVALRQGAEVTAVLARRTALRRKEAWVKTEDQVLAANLDLAFILAALDGELNLRRLERYLTTAWESGAQPVVILTKADLCPEVGETVAEVEAVAVGAEVLPCSSLTGDGLEAVRSRLQAGHTAVLLGSSGVGKSTLINRWLGTEALRTREVHSSGEGRHTTSHRQLLLLPGGGLVIDTPGLRELQLWQAGSGLGRAFADVEELAGACRFNDCRHAGEPGCAVAEAVSSGALTPGRLASYGKLQRELRALEVRRDERLRWEERRRWKIIHKAVRNRTRP